MFDRLFKGFFADHGAGNGKEIDAYLTSMESIAHFMGAVLIQHAGQTLLCKGYGYAAEGVRNTPSTIFQIASLTKQFTAAAIMKLHEDRLIDLEGTINQYLPSNCRCRKWNDIEVRHLLSHKSGIPDYTDCDDYWKVCKRLTPDKVIDDAKAEDLDFSPGSDYFYSNTGYDLLGKIIEEISHVPYGEFVTQKLLKPAGMNHSGIRKPKDAPIPDAAVGYCVNNLKLREDIRDEYSVLFADGAMYSTVGDLAIWSEVLDGKSTVLSSESLKLMISHQYGIIVDKAFGSKRLHHSGSMAGFRSDFCKFPEEGLTIIILSNNFDFVPEYLSANIADYVLNNRPMPAVVPFPNNFNFSPFLTTFYWDEDEDDDENGDGEGDDEDDEDEEYTFKLNQNRLVLQGDNPTECYLLSDAYLFNASEGQEFQLKKDGALIVYDSDGEEEGVLYSMLN